MDEAGEGSASERITAAEAFSILGNETRIEILRALWKSDGPLSFAELRRAVAPDDRGNFSYHLGKLAEHFVEKTETGYVLRFAGAQVVRAVLAGTITDAPSVPTGGIDERCVYCGAPVEMAYESERISVRCTGCGGVVGNEFPPGTYMYYEFPPAGLVGRSREAAVDAAHVLYDSKVAPMMKGICPECAGRVTLTHDVCADHAPGESGLCPNCGTRFSVWTTYECGHCRYGRTTATWFAAMNHPAVIAFCHDHGLEETIPFRKLTWDNARFVRDVSQTVLEVDPYRFRVTIPIEGETLVVEMDENLDVLGVERERADT